MARHGARAVSGSVLEAVSDVIEAGAEPGLRQVSVRLAGGLASSEEVGGGAAGPGQGEGDEGHQQIELAGVGQARVLEVEAAGLGVAEEAFDGPAFAIGRQRGARRDVGDDDQPFVLQPLGGEGEERSARRRRPKAGVEGAGPAAACAAGRRG